MANQFTRRDFLRSGTAAGLGATAGSMMLAGCTDALARGGLQV